MEKANAVEELDELLTKINSVIKIEDILHENITKDFIKGYYKDYYESSQVGYKIFHSNNGCVHTALNFNGEFDEKGSYAQPKLIDDFIKQNRQICNVIELGCGKGFNCQYLAKRNGDVSFLGIDLTPEFIRHANNEEDKPSNLNFSLGDFHHLSVPDENYDLVFEVEAVCHAKDIGQVLKEAHRVLRPGGFYVAFDMFKPAGFDNMDARLVMASKISDITMGVGNGQRIDDFVKAACEASFELVKQDDVTHAILPSLARFQRLSSKYFRSKFLARLALKLLPGHIVKNAIAGLLAPFTVAGKALGYYHIVLKKNQAIMPAARTKNGHSSIK